MNRIKHLIILSFLIYVNFTYAQETFKTNSESLKIYIDNKLEVEDWKIDYTLNPDIFEVEVKSRKRLIVYRDDKNSISFEINKEDTIDFVVIDKNNQPAKQRIITVKPNVNFTKSYIKKHKGKIIVDIPEVSELVNIIMVLHKDAEKDENMFDTKSEYYKRVKTYFEPFKDHPIIDTIQKYISNLKHDEEHNLTFFSNESYGYYYAMKMNACAYEYDNQANIKNNGIIRVMAKGWNNIDPMKDISLIKDFAYKSNFRKFYNANKYYYDELISIYNKLNPIQKMQNWLDEKFKFNYGSYLIYFSPLVYGAHSTQGFEDKGFKQTFMFIAKAEIDKTFSPIMNELLESRVVFTEIDHNYVNPISYKYLNEVNNCFSDRDIWTKGEITSSYNNPFMVFNEYMTFAVYSLYILDNYDTKNFNEYLPIMENQMENSRGFKRFKDFNRELIKIYEEDKKQAIENIYMRIFDWAKLINSSK